MSPTKRRGPKRRIRHDHNGGDNPFEPEDPGPVEGPPPPDQPDLGIPTNAYIRRDHPGAMAELVIVRGKNVEVIPITAMMLERLARDAVALHFSRHTASWEQMWSVNYWDNLEK